MIHWSAREGWMEFPLLTLNVGLTRTYTLAYKLTDRGSETWSTRFTRFKSKDLKASYGGARLLYAAFPPLFSSLNLAPADCVFLTALSSSETVADPSRQLPFITRELASLMETREAVGSLSKQVHNSIHNRYSAAERDAELAKANYVCAKLPAKNVFVFDDFVTRGGTLSKIAQSIRATNPGSTVYGVALAKTERVSYCKNPENDHVPAQWAKVWTDGENEVGLPIGVAG